MYQQKLGARAEYQQQEGQRVKESVSLSDRFRKLKSLTVEFDYYNPEGTTKNSQIKYEVNIQNAKSVFRFNCPNRECVRGDFDLTEDLVNAVAAHRTSVTGEKSCKGWLSKTTINTVRCRNILRYKIRLSY